MSESQVLQELYARMQGGGFMCPDCRNMVDTPLHEYGCARGRAEREADSPLREEDGMSEPEPPSVVTLRWCPECGAITGYKAYGANVGGMEHEQWGCHGVPRELTYVLASEPQDAE